MSYQVLARKWRPRSFDTLVGQTHVVKALSNALEQNRLHHAYLFTGTRGVGKTTLARILAKSLNCETGRTSSPCGKCLTCQEIDQGRYVDLIEVDAASNTKVDEMRELLENAQYAPTTGRFKVYIIDEVHMLSTSAFNAMLKTLEEPPEHVKFILATTDPQKVPVTVLSRCIQFNLRQMASSDVVLHLQNILEQESVSFESEALGMIARAAQGSMRDALSLTDQAIAYGQQTVKLDDVMNMLGTIDQRYLFSILNALVEEDIDTMIAIADQMQARSLSFETALTDLAQLLHQIAMLQVAPNSLADDLPERKSLLSLSQKISAESIQLFYQITLLAKRDLSLAPDTYAGFTMCLLRLHAFIPNNKPQAQASASKDQASEIDTTVKKNTSKPEQSASQVAAQQPAQSNTHNSTNNLSAQEFSFDGNWRKLIGQLKLGIVRTLAQNCEVSAYEANSITLLVQPEQKHLLMPQYQEKLTTAISNYYNKKIQLTFNVGGNGNTVAKQIKTEKAQIQSKSEQAIEEDQFVKALISDFDATIVQDSIKPI